MRRSKLTYAAAGFTLALAAAGCDQGLTDINVNPNAPTDVGPQFLFPQGAVAVTNLVRGQGMDLTMTSLWAQHYAKVQYTEEDWYDIRPGTIDTWWSAFYSGGLMDLTQATQKAQAADRPNLAAPPQIMMAWTHAAMTDMWGDIPYSEANRGAEILTPVYDRQEDIYNGILASLASASSMIDVAAPGYGSADPIYGGNMARWQKFANSLRLRYAMRLSKVNATKAQAEVQAAVAAPGGVFTSNADNATLDWPGDGINDAPLYSNFVKAVRDDHRISRTIVDALKALSDPRLPIYAQPALNTGEYTGLQNGLTNNQANAIGFGNVSKIGTYFSQANTPTILMHYAEVQFLLAEARERGWITTGTAAGYYMEGIRAAISMFGVAQADIDAYLVQASVIYNPTTGLEQIARQKWLSLFGQGSEAWAEWRRTGVPTLVPGPAATLTEVARRLTYPLSEQSFNLANLNAAISTASGGDVLTGRVWWDRP